MNRVNLQSGREKRLLQGHRWVFSNEVVGRLTDLEPGSWVEVFSSRGVSLGTGYVNPYSLIAVRLVCPPATEPSREFFLNLLKDADARRRRMYPGSTCYRLIFGESDGWPGLVVDRYGDILVYQVTTLGMARMEPLIQELLLEWGSPWIKALVYRNDVPVRNLEGLPLERGVAWGELPEKLWVDVDGLELSVSPLAGQKTGLYLDQRDNRQALRNAVEGRRVLDLFCYNGAWSLAAARFGAAETVGVDESAEAIAQAQANASRNGFADRCAFRQGEVFRTIKTVGKDAFDVIILDPPAFVKSRSALPDAIKGYTDLNRRALLLLRSGGLLVTCSCSYHLTEALFWDVLLQAAQASGRRLRLLEARGQAKDHPVLLAMPETYYLKCFILEVC